MGHFLVEINRRRLLSGAGHRPLTWRVHAVASAPGARCVQSSALIPGSTILDDYSRYVIGWKLCGNMRAQDVTDTLGIALAAADPRALRQRSTLMIHNRAGKIRSGFRLKGWPGGSQGLAGGSLQRFMRRFSGHLNGKAGSEFGQKVAPLSAISDAPRAQFAGVRCGF